LISAIIVCMKRIFISFFTTFIIGLTFLPGCITDQTVIPPPSPAISIQSLTPANSPLIKPSSPAAANFNFIFKDDGYELDTFTGIFSKFIYLGQGPPAVTNLVLTPDEMQTIYRKMIDIDFFTYPDYFKVEIPEGSPTGMVTPADTFYFKVKYNSTFKELHWTDSITNPDLRAENLRSLIKLIRDTFMSKDEYKQLPPFKLLRI
jgi:hypothetical protein